VNEAKSILLIALTILTKSLKAGKKAGSRLVFAAGLGHALKNECEL